MLRHFQILGGNERGLHSFADHGPSVHDDLFRLGDGRDCFAGTPIRLEGSGIFATNRAAKVHGVAGPWLSGT